MTSRVYDLIVVGGGPAGACAAAEAASRGMRVALLEKQILPRHKTCGGGMPMVMSSLLRDFAPGAVVEANVTMMRHTYDFADPVLAPINPNSSEPELSLWMVQRPLFDNLLCERASGLGVEVLDGVSVRSVEVEADRVEVRAEHAGGSWTGTARCVVGADGANGIVARHAGLRRKRAIAIGMEVELPHAWGSAHPDVRRDVLHLEYGAVNRGYAWVFPKADHLNVGAGVFRGYEADASNSGVREELQRAILSYLKMLEVPFDPSEMKFHAHPLPIWNGREQLSTTDGTILLAGDAAGLINPFFGDGILHAVKSGIIAAECAAVSTTQQYTRKIHDEFAANFDAALRLAKFFYQWPGLCYRHGVHRPGATRTATRLLCGDALFTNLTGRAMRRLRSALAGSQP